ILSRFVFFCFPKYFFLPAVGLSGSLLKFFFHFIPFSIRFFFFFFLFFFLFFFFFGVWFGFGFGLGVGWVWGEENKSFWACFFFVFFFFLSFFFFFFFFFFPLLFLAISFCGSLAWFEVGVGGWLG